MPELFGHRLHAARALPPDRTARPGRRRPARDARRRRRARRARARVPHRHRASPSTCSSTAPSTSVAASCAAFRSRGRPAVGVEGPWYYEPEGLGFFRTFGGGLLVTCGIEHSLFMAEDSAAQYHYPPKQTESFGLHGRISNRPARLIGYGERWDGDECILFAEGETQVATVFGEQLVLRRRIEARVGESRLHVHDVVENVGHDLTPHMLLYHVNAGFPVVDEGSEILVAATGVAARGDHPVEGYRTLVGPGGRVRRAGLRARARRRARRQRARGGRQPASSGSGSTRCSTGAAPPPLRVADARRGHVRRRHRAVHEPHRRAARRARAWRADRARGRRAPQLRPRARCARRTPARSTDSPNASNAQAAAGPSTTPSEQVGVVPASGRPEGSARPPQEGGLPRRRTGFRRQPW